MIPVLVEVGKNTNSVTEDKAVSFLNIKPDISKRGYPVFYWNRGIQMFVIEHVSLSYRTQMEI